MIDGSGQAGAGIAYSTTEPAHLLNVPADGMSAWAGDPDHFARVFEAEGGDRSGFAQRRMFGRYLRSILAEAVASGNTEVVQATAVGATRDDNMWQLRFKDGASINAQALVLASGNQKPESLTALAGASERLIANPWGAEARRAVHDLAASGEPVFLVGTGLTMVDLVLSLDAAGHHGRIVALSRRGQVPRGHSNYDPVLVAAEEVPRGSVRELTRWLRRRSAEVGWRAAIDSLRPHSHPLWQSLGTEQQRRFLRHARPWWDVHRHRIAPEVAATVAQLIADGRLEIIAGRVLNACEVPGAMEVRYRRRRAEQPQTENFAFAFNCTGPLHSMANSKDPLLRSLLDAGQVRPDAIGIGLEVDGTCRAGEHLWAVGPLTKGRYWEIIAVPDIRDQAAEIADDIQRELGE
jgi:uncharacterized NAD(P)/FAD-binding protein YdhS